MESLPTYKRARTGSYSAADNLQSGFASGAAASRGVFEAPEPLESLKPEPVAQDSKGPAWDANILQLPAMVVLEQCLAGLGNLPASWQTHSGDLRGLIQRPLDQLKARPDGQAIAYASLSTSPKGALECLMHLLAIHMTVQYGFHAYGVSVFAACRAVVHHCRAAGIGTPPEAAFVDGPELPRIALPRLRVIRNLCFQVENRLRAAPQPRMEQPAPEVPVESKHPQAPRAGASDARMDKFRLIRDQLKTTRAVDRDIADCIRSDGNGGCVMDFRLLPAPSLNNLSAKKWNQIIDHVVKALHPKGAADVDVYFPGGVNNSLKNPVFKAGFRKLSFESGFQFAVSQMRALDTSKTTIEGRFKVGSPQPIFFPVYDETLRLVVAIDREPDAAFLDHAGFRPMGAAAGGRFERNVSVEWPNAHPVMWNDLRDRMSGRRAESKAEPEAFPGQAQPAAAEPESRANGPLSGLADEFDQASNEERTARLRGHPETLAQKGFARLTRAFDLLFEGQPPDNAADPEVTRKQFRKMSLKYHPDKNDNSPYSEKMFKAMQEAHELIRAVVAATASPSHPAGAATS